MIGSLAAFVFATMIGEAAVSARNERALRAAGAVEPRDDVYLAMLAAYPACFLAMLAEGVARHAAVDRRCAIGLAVLAGAKALKYWAIASLGRRWAFRVLVPPASARIRRVRIAGCRIRITRPSSGN